MLKNLKFRVVEKTTFGGKKFFIPQVYEDNIWYDIDYINDEFNLASDGYGDIICKDMKSAVKIINDYYETKKEEYKEMIENVEYHEVTLRNEN